MRSCNQSKSIFDFQQHVQRLSNGLKAMFPTQCDLLLGKTMTANMADTCEQKLNFFVENQLMLPIVKSLLLENQQNHDGSNVRLTVKK